jgi:hypothetical protein
MSQVTAMDGQFGTHTLPRATSPSSMQTIPSNLIMGV